MKTESKELLSELIIIQYLKNLSIFIVGFFADFTNSQKREEQQKIIENI